MRLLVLGGTRFLGPALIEAGLDRGWQVTAVARGVSGEAPTGAQLVRLDRHHDPQLTALADSEFDLIVDTWAGAPKVTAASATALRDRAATYVYVSSRSVYAQPLRPGAAEDAPVVEGHALADTTDYAADKRGAELAVMQAFADRALLLRAGLVLGPREYVGRLPWWLRRISLGGDVLVPGPPDLPIQYVDVRDLAAFALDAASAGRTGPYNVVSKPGHATMGSLIAACQTATGSNASLHWADPDVIAAAGIEPWTQLPIWIPPGSPDYGMHQADTSLAYAHGLRCRPISATVADTWDWLLAAGPDVGLGAPGRPVGIDPAVERRVLSGLIDHRVVRS
jgi:2'-hydroxyisoflavone reductase